MHIQAVLTCNGIFLVWTLLSSDFFEFSGEIFEFSDLQEAGNKEIWPARPRRGRAGQPSEVASLEKIRNLKNRGQKVQKSHEKVAFRPGGCFPGQRVKLQSTPMFQFI